MNNIEDMQKSFEGQKFKVFSPFKCDISKNEDGNYVDDTTIFAFAWFCRGIASQAQQDDICPECRRKKAKSADDCAAGLCPKWYAIRDKESANDCRNVSRAQQESKLHWCGTCEQNVERGCGDSACQYRYKLPPVPEGGE